jgi:uncharacterized membrane protein
MSTQAKWLRFILTMLLGIICNISHADQAAGNVTLYTPYTKISVPPGETVEYTIDVINNTKEIQNVEISLVGMPNGWVYSLKSGGLTIAQISILPGEKKSLSLHVDIPLKVNKGNYYFKVQAKGITFLPLVINVSKQGTTNTEFTAQQPNMQGSATSNFTFITNLKNRTGEKQQYALMANAPRGWTVIFKLSGQSVTSVSTEPNIAQQITVDIKAPLRVETGKYKIPVTAATSTSSADLELEVVITGSYSLELTTPTGLLSTDITAGGSKKLELKIMNTGSSELNDITTESSTPANWSVTFDPKKVDKLQPGKSAQVFATIVADKKAIPGDYKTNIEAKTPEVSSTASFRISVETPLLWGWVGVFVILGALACVYYLFRKYGRR